MKTISITTFKNNYDYYMDLCSTEDIYITRYGKVVAVLSCKDYYQTLFKLYGCLKTNNSNYDYDKMIGDEILRRCGY